MMLRPVQCRQRPLHQQLLPGHADQRSRHGLHGSEPRGLQPRLDQRHLERILPGRRLRRDGQSKEMYVGRLEYLPAGQLLHRRRVLHGWQPARADRSAPFSD
jgi:hypothetical protein